MSELRIQLKAGFLSGAKKGGSTFAWVCKIIIPVSFAVAVLQWSGWLYQIDFLLNPLMRLINLPAEAALPLIAGMVVGNYAAIASMAVLPLTVEQMTLIAIFSLIAHSLIMEGIIQFRSGINLAKITLVRIIAAILTVLVVSQFIGDTSQSIVVPAEFMAHTPFVEALRVWAAGMLSLSIKILVIIMLVMIVLELLKSLDWIKYLHKAFRPFMRILGLSNQAVMMWVAAAAFGLVLGSAVILEEATKGTLSKGELEPIHISIGINHSLVEDPALFMALGLNAFWLWVPRFVTAIIAVHALRAIRYLKGRLVHS
ncbi:MAG: iron transporter [Dehalococcoidia bacterium]|nr:iron transporter [Dehalococcoidia bacterium]